MPKRLDGEDTVDVVTHFLHRWQAEGFGVKDVACDVEYAAVKPGARRLPVQATVTVRLVPTRG